MTIKGHVHSRTHVRLHRRKIKELRYRCRLSISAHIATNYSVFFLPSLRLLSLYNLTIRSARKMIENVYDRIRIVHMDGVGLYFRPSFEAAASKFGE